MWHNTKYYLGNLYVAILDQIIMLYQIAWNAPNRWNSETFIETIRLTKQINEPNTI